MAISQDLELPIKSFSVMGPGVDEIENRKEDNGRHALNKNELKNNLAKVRQNMLTGLQSLVSGSK
jgi:hypothetical protein